jgi:hypothetical protein
MIVVSSEFRIVTAAGLQPSLLPPIRDRINYLLQILIYENQLQSNIKLT